MGAAALLFAPHAPFDGSAIFSCSPGYAPLLMPPHLKPSLLFSPSSVFTERASHLPSTTVRDSSG